MIVATPTKSEALLDAGPIYRMSVAQYHELGEAGILSDDASIELLEGLLVQKMTKNPPHSYTVMLLRTRLEPVLPPEFHYRIQEPITLSDGEPEPDGAIARGTLIDYIDQHPVPVDIPLIIEVADISLARDQGIKLRSYARAGIPVYWIVNLIDHQIEVFADPDPVAIPTPTYRNRAVFETDDSVPFSIGDLRIDFRVADLLPPV